MFVSLHTNGLNIQMTRLRRNVFQTELHRQDQTLADLRSWWHKLSLDFQKQYLKGTRKAPKKITPHQPYGPLILPGREPIPPDNDPFQRSQLESQVVRPSC